MKYFKNPDNYTEEVKAYKSQALDTLIGLINGGDSDLRSAYQRMLDYGLCEHYEVGSYLAEIMLEYSDEYETAITEIDYVALVCDKCASNLKKHIEEITDYEFDIGIVANFLGSEIILYEDNIKDFVEHLENLDKEDLEKIKDKFNEDNVLNERFKEHLSDCGFDLDEILNECMQGE